MTSIINDLSTLTTIPEESLNRLVNLSECCICDAVEETRLRNQEVCEIDLGVGVLYILVSNEVVKYKFIPSKKLEVNINDTIRKGTNSMTNFVESTLVNKILNTYKDML